MKILLLGATGMLGSAFVRATNSFSKVKLICPIRGDWPLNETPGNVVLIPNCKELSISLVEELILTHSPRFVINCIGVIKQNIGAPGYIESLCIWNSLFPHQLNNVCDKHGTHLIHYSTDCVFDGTEGNYAESAPCTAKDHYGMSKFLGEPTNGNSTVFRTSIIGPEIRGKKSLFEWFVSQDKVHGYSNAFFSGVPTIFLAKLTLKFICNDRIIPGLFNVASDRISKFDLLTLVKDKLCLDLVILPDTEVKIDRTLNPNHSRLQLNLQIPNWDQLIEELAQDYKNVQKQ